MQTKTILALALAAAAEPVSRRLRDTVDLTSVHEKAEAKALTGALSFKLDSAAAAKHGDALAHKVADLIDCSKAERTFRHAGIHEEKHVAKGLHLWYSVKCADGAQDRAAASTKAAAKLHAYLDRSDEDHEGVVLIEPALVHLQYNSSNSSRATDDPYYSYQAGHYDAVNLETAWDTTMGSADVVVQVIDTGLDLDHEDLQMNIWKNTQPHPTTGETEWPDNCNDGIDNDGNGFIDDCHGYNHAEDSAGDASSGNYLGGGSHGSHCGGTIAADNNNGVGGAGVAGGDGTEDSGVKLMVSVVFGATWTDGFAEALVYGADNGARVSSNSWGYIYPGDFEQSVLDAIDYYTDSEDDGGQGIEGAVVFAAGNDNSNADYYPAYYDKTIAVAATDNDGNRAYFSNYGDWIDISAPGMSILSTVVGGYDYYDGTSMACPHVAGILALCLSANPGLERQDVLDMLYATADPLTADLGAGMADAGAFVAQCANGAPTMQPTVSLAPTTAMPTFKPTMSLAPTASCVCDQKLELTVVTDWY